MADLEKTIQIIFGGDDRVSKVISGIEGKMSGLSSVAETVASPFALIADGVLKVDAALAALAAGGLAVAFAKSVQFESALVDLKKVLGDKELAGLETARGAAIALSEAYGESSADILQSMANFKQAGFDLNESMSLTKNTMDLVIAGGLDAATASDLVVASLKGFKAPAQDAARLVDILNEVSNQYATDVEQLARGMAGLSPIAKTMGFSMEETAGILTPVIEVFRSGDEAAIALKTGLLKLIDDAKPVREALASIGVSQTDANGALRSGRDIMLDVAKAFVGLEDNQKLFVTQQLVGIDQSARMVEVFNQLSKTSEITAVALKASGSAAQEVAVRLETAEVQLNIFKSSFENLAIAVGDEFRLAATKAIEGGSAIAQALRGAVSDGSFDPVFDAFENFVNQIGAYFKAVAKALPEALGKIDWDEFLKAFGSLGRQVEKFFDGIDLTTAEGLSKALQGVVDTITALVNVTSGMVQAFRPYFDALAEAVSRAKTMDSETAASFGKILLNAKMVVDAGLGVAAAFAVLGEAGTKMSNVFDVVFGGIGAVWNALSAAFDGFVLNIVDGILFVTRMAETLNSALGLKGIVGSLGGVIDSLEQFKAGVKANQVDEWGDAVNRAKQAWNGLTGATDEAKAGLDGVGAAAQKASKDVATVGGSVDIDTSPAISTLDKFKTTVGEKKTSFEIIALLDRPSLDKAKQDVEKAVEDKPLAIVPTVRLELFEAQTKRILGLAEHAAKAFEWKAKVDIAQAEAAAKRVEAAFGSVNTAIGDTGDLLGSLWEDYSEAQGADKKKLFKQIEQEERRRQETFESQKELIAAEVKATEAQTRLAEARARAIERGDGLITINADGLEPELEAFMWKIVEKVRIRGVEESAEFLLGM